MPGFFLQSDIIQSRSKVYLLKSKMVIILWSGISGIYFVSGPCLGIFLVKSRMLMQTLRLGNVESL